MQFGDREKKFIGYLVLVVAILVASYLGAYNGTPPLPPIPEQAPEAQTIQDKPGPPGDFVSRSQGGQYNDAIKIAVPTANATADTALWVDNASVAQPFSIQDAGTPVLEGYNGGGVKAYAPTAIATTVPGMVVDSAGVSNILEVRDAGTPVWYVSNGGNVTGTGGQTFTGEQTYSGGLTSNNWAKVAAPTAIATATPGMVVDSLGVSNILEVRDAATPVFTVRNGGGFDGVIRYDTAGSTLICGTTTITDNTNVSHGLSTPAFAMCSLNAADTGDASHCTAQVSGANVTVRVYQTALTPTANSAGASVNWCVIGAP